MEVYPARSMDEAAGTEAAAEDLLVGARSPCRRALGGRAPGWRGASGSRSGDSGATARGPRRERKVMPLG